MSTQAPTKVEEMLASLYEQGKQVMATLQEKVAQRDRLNQEIAAIGRQVDHLDGAVQTLEQLVKMESGVVLQFPASPMPHEATLGDESAPEEVPDAEGEPVS